MMNNNYTRGFEQQKAMERERNQKGAAREEIKEYYEAMNAVRKSARKLTFEEMRECSEIFANIQKGHAEHEANREHFVYTVNGKTYNQGRWYHNYRNVVAEQSVVLTREIESLKKKLERFIETPDCTSEEIEVWNKFKVSAKKLNALNGERKILKGLNGGATFGDNYLPMSYDAPNETWSALKGGLFYQMSYHLTASDNWAFEAFNHESTIVIYSQIAQQITMDRGTKIFEGDYFYGNGGNFWSEEDDDYKFAALKAYQEFILRPLGYKPIVITNDGELEAACKYAYMNGAEYVICMRNHAERTTFEFGPEYEVTEKHERKNEYGNVISSFEVAVKKRDVIGERIIPAYRSAYIVKVEGNERWLQNQYIDNAWGYRLDGGASKLAGLEGAGADPNMTGDWARDSRISKDGVDLQIAANKEWQEWIKRLESAGDERLVDVKDLAYEHKRVIDDDKFISLEERNEYGARLYDILGMQIDDETYMFCKNNPLADRICSGDSVNAAVNALLDLNYAEFEIEELMEDIFDYVTSK